MERKKVHADCKNFRIIGFSLIIGSRQILNYFQFDGSIIVLLRCNRSFTWPDVVNTCNVDKIDAIRNCFMYERFLELQYLQWFERYVQDYIDISAVMSHLIQAVADSCALRWISWQCSWNVVCAWVYIGASSQRPQYRWNIVFSEDHQWTLLNCDGSIDVLFPTDCEITKVFFVPTNPKVLTHLPGMLPH